MSTIYEEIKKDHDLHRDLLDRLDKTSGDSPERRELFEKLRVEMTAHANAEEQTFYASLIEDPETQEQARHSIAEHKETDDLLEELDEMAFDNPGWLAKFRKLKEELEHHMEEEEEEVFPEARDVIESDNAEQLAGLFRDREAEERESA